MDATKVAKGESNEEHIRNMRPFIIKTVQLIAQGRNGNQISTPCLTNVGATNNLTFDEILLCKQMIYLEDDPDIGVTLKRSLEPTYHIYPGDTISLQIFLRLDSDPSRLLTVELWHINVDSFDISNSESPPKSQSKVKFFESLGLLLKSVLITTRLLPAYKLAAEQRSHGHQSCYIIQRFQRITSSFNRNDNNFDTSKLLTNDKVYVDLPNMHLGSDHLRRDIGMLSTPNGKHKLSLQVFYRSLESIQNANNSNSLTYPIHSGVMSPVKDERFIIDEKALSNNTTAANVQGNEQNNNNNNYSRTKKLTTKIPKNIINSKKHDFTRIFFEARGSSDEINSNFSKVFNNVVRNVEFDFFLNGHYFNNNDEDNEMFNNFCEDDMIDDFHYELEHHEEVLHDFDNFLSTFNSRFISKE